MNRKDAPKDAILKGVCTKFIDENGLVYAVSEDGNRLNVITRTKNEAIAEGILIATHPVIIGKQDAISTNLEDLTELDVDITPVPASAISLELLSSVTTDNAAGDGARTVKVYGLDTDFNEIEETVILNGTTAVDLTLLFRRINALHVVTNGVANGGTADGTLTLRGVGGGTEFNRIEAGGNMSRSCFFTIPANKTGFITSWSAGLLTNNTDTTGVAILRATCEWKSRALIEGVFLFQDIILGEIGTVKKELSRPLKLPAKCDVKISVQKLGGAGDMFAGGNIELHYE